MADPVAPCVAQRFAGNTLQVDFDENPTDAAARINRWVSHHTERMLPQMIGPSDVAEADLAIVNAIYFQGKWASPFNVKATHAPANATLRNEEKAAGTIDSIAWNRNYTSITSNQTSRNTN